MYAITGLIFLFALGDAFGRTLTPDDIIWYPIEGHKNGYTSAYGDVYVDTKPNYYPYERKERSVVGAVTWNDFADRRGQFDDRVVFPEDAIFEREPRRDCLASCPRTPQYNPVCGSDRENYHNMATLKCTAFCGKDVTFVHYGNCGKGLPLIFRPTPRPPRRAPAPTRSDDVNRYNW